ncbi:MAG: hypothetical protein PWR01_3975 [Clostridiales bacterium]|nr:hypothetical protein [Clostridiales bacterium]MDN5282902.1 hypothetical protein [Candidatus Ozemobacter sp.]
MRKLFLLICFLLVYATAGADSWQVYTSGNGLSDNNVHCFAAMKTLMAVGNNSGVDIYDGETSSWQQLKLPDEIASNPVKDIAFDENGHLWAASARGLAHIQGEQLYYYGVEQGLPTVDIDRIQIRKNKIFAGCFGGYVCQAEIPQTGRTSFVPVNYQAHEIDNGLKIRSVGISGLGMINRAKGWVSTKGEGLIEIVGANSYQINGLDGKPEDWVNDFWVFEGPSKAVHTISITPEHISLIKNSNCIQKVKLPAENCWLKCIVAVKENPDVYTCLEMPEMDNDGKKFFEFLNKRSLFVGTRNHGLWRYQKGIWKNYSQFDSSLPSDCINRLYLMGQTLVACTNGGLVIISLNSTQFDDFKKQGLGNVYAKTLFPFPPRYAHMVPFNFICKGTSYWFTHMLGLSRWRPSSTPKIRSEDRTIDLSSRLEILRDSTDDFLNFAEPGSAQDDLPEPDIATEDILTPSLDGFWQLFTRSYMFSYDEEVLFDVYGTEIRDHDLYEMYSDKITAMAIDSSTDMLWLVFEGKKLCRLKMQWQIVEIDGKKFKKEKPDWRFMEKFHPWSGDTELNCLWLNDNKLYIGSKGDGFYILKNPQAENIEKTPYEWEHYSVYEGLTSDDCIGFTHWKSILGSNLVILHPKQISLWDGEFFRNLSTGAERQYTCCDAGSDGNLWVGSWGGLFRFTPEANLRSYTGTNAFFESNYITAVAALPTSTHRETGVWVACDALAEFTKLSDNFQGSDQPPTVITQADGSKKIIELELDGSSMHFFDGRTWEKWKMAGIKYIFLDGDYVWTSSNIRVRRLLAPR